jgi:hypothetical protein
MQVGHGGFSPGTTTGARLGWYTRQPVSTARRHGALLDAPRTCSTARCWPWVVRLMLAHGDAGAGTAMVRAMALSVANAAVSCSDSDWAQRFMQPSVLSSCCLGDWPEADPKLRFMALG